MQTTLNLILLLCGLLLQLDEINASFRIVGGVAVGKNEYIPYQVSIQFVKRGGAVEHFCGGSIISPNSILTAAHCVHERNAKDLNIVAGIQDLNKNDGQRTQVESFVIHKDYEEFKSNDIAIIYVKPPLKLDGKKVDKIDYTNSEQVGGNVKLLLTGWGAISADGGSYPNRLQKLTYSTITNEQCKISMATITDAEMCAIVRAKGSCSGDSGGPIVLKKDDKWVQVGIVSYGTLVCANDYPDVYTRTSAYIDWINEHKI